MTVTDIRFGFGPSPRPEYVYVDHGKSPTGWYLLDKQTDPIPIDEVALTGFIKTVEAITREFRGKEKRKLQIHVSAGPRNYIIRSGFYTAFSRCILAALAKLEPKHLDEALCIETHLGNEENKTVFATIYRAANGGPIRCHYPKTEVDVDRLYQRVQTIFEARRNSRSASAPQNSSDVRRAG